MGGSLADIAWDSAGLIMDLLWVSGLVSFCNRRSFPSQETNSDLFPLCLISYPQIEENPAFICVDLYPMLFKAGPGYLRI